MGRQRKKSTQDIIKKLETTNLTLEEIGKKFKKTKQNISYIKRKYKVVRPKKIDKDEKGVKELMEISNLIKKEIEAKEQLKGNKKEKSNLIKKYCEVCGREIEGEMFYCKFCFKNLGEYVDFRQLKEYVDQLYKREQEGLCIDANRSVIKAIEGVSVNVDKIDPEVKKVVEEFIESEGKGGS